MPDVDLPGAKCANKKVNAQGQKNLWTVLAVIISQHHYNVSKSPPGVCHKSSGTLSNQVGARLKLNPFTFLAANDCMIFWRNYNLVMFAFLEFKNKSFKGLRNQFKSSIFLYLLHCQIEKSKHSIFWSKVLTTDGAIANSNGFNWCAVWQA